MERRKTKKRTIYPYICIYPSSVASLAKKKRKHGVENSHGGGANGRASSRLLKRNRFVCVIRQIVPETAYLYDAVHLYERSLLKALDEDRDPRNGREMVATLYGVHYRSAMGYVYGLSAPSLYANQGSTPKTSADIFDEAIIPGRGRRKRSVIKRKSRGSMIKRRVMRRLLTWFSM